MEAIDPCVFLSATFGDIFLLLSNRFRQKLDELQKKT